MVAIPSLAAVATSLIVALYNSLPSQEARVYITSRGPDGTYLGNRLVSGKNNVLIRLVGAIRMLSQGNGWIDPCAFRSGDGNQMVPQAVITHHLGAQGSWIGLEMPMPFSSGRVYVVTDGELEFGTTGPSANGFCPLQEPSAFDTGMPSAHRSYGFMEFSVHGDELYVNPSLVDFVGTPLAVRLETSEGTLDAKGLPSDVVQLMCDGLHAKAMEEGSVYVEP